MKHSIAVIVLVIASGANCGWARADPTLGVFSPARQSQLSMTTSSQANDFRAAIVAAYPSAAFIPMPTISEANLTGGDMVILSSATGGTAAITPLTADEQNVLRAFVNAGGGAVLFTDNNTFARAVSTPANSSLVGPFGATRRARVCRGSRERRCSIRRHCLRCSMGRSDRCRRTAWGGAGGIRTLRAYRARRC